MFSTSHPAHLALIGLQMASCLEFVLESVCDDILHVLQLTLEVLQLLIVVLNHVLVVNVFTLQVLSLPLDLLQLLA